MESAVRSVYFRRDFTIKTVVVSVRKLAWKMYHTIEAFYSYTILSVVD